MSGGLITGLIFGIATLIVGIIIAFLVVSTLTDANLLQEGRTSVTVTNETGGDLNTTGYTLTGASVPKVLSGGFTLTTIWANDTEGTGEYDISVPTANATVSDDGVVTLTDGAVAYSDVSYSYTYTLKTDTEVSADAMSTNFTSGVDNVSSKVPTLLLVAAIVLILGVLVLLVETWRRMGIGGSDL